MAEARKVHAGDIVIREGEDGNEAYLILAGKVEIRKAGSGGDIRLAVLGKGEVFGEMAIIDEQPRSASAVALEDGELLVVTRERFLDTMRQHPEALFPYLRQLFERLRIANQLAAAAAHEAAASAPARQAAAIPPAPSKVPAGRPAAPRPMARHSESLDESLAGPVVVAIEALTEELRSVVEKERIVITRFPFKVGRPSNLGALDVFTSNDLQVRDAAPFVVSRNHFAIDNQAGRLLVIDRGSRLGTIVNGRPIGLPGGPTTAPLHVGENQIIIGPPRSPYVFSVTLTPGPP